MPVSSPYIAFPGTAAEAFAFYADVFGGALDLIRYGDMPPLEGMGFEPPAEAVAHAELSGGHATLAGGDSFAEGCGGNGPEGLASDVYSMLLTLPTTAIAEQLIERLTAAGGQIGMPFAKAPWGDHYGQVTDHFGLKWAFSVPGENPAS